MITLDEWLSVAQIAKERNLKPPTVRSWCRKGWLPAEQVGRSYRVKRSDWEEFLRKGFEWTKKADGLAAFATRPTYAAAL